LPLPLCISSSASARNVERQRSTRLRLLAPDRAMVKGAAEAELHQE
jgi:hypothetical protein